MSQPEDQNPQVPKGSRKRGRAGTPSKGLDKEEEHLDEKDIASM
jgi:hypothetical protein